MAWNDRDRAQLGEQSPSEKNVRADARSRDVSSEHRNQPVERETIGERGKQKKIDTRAGDEGIDESNFTGGEQGTERSRPSKTERSAASGKQSSPGKKLPGNEREDDKSAHRMAGNQPGTIEQAGASTRGRSGDVRRNERQSEDEFSGQGGQQGGAFREDREGTGYTSDRSGQLQHDDSLGGSQGRHGRTGSRHGASGSPQTGTSEKERVGGQTAQNPRIPRKGE